MSSNYDNKITSWGPVIMAISVLGQAGAFLLVFLIDEIGITIIYLFTTIFWIGLILWLIEITETANRKTIGKIALISIIISILSYCAWEGNPITDLFIAPSIILGIAWLIKKENEPKKS
jgi:hypothetical protein